MKKVRESDLRDLIIIFYCKFIAHISEEEHYNLPIEERAEVIVRSTHILVWWKFDDSDSQIDMENYINNFAEEIEKVTFGNLKVTYCEIEKERDASKVEIYIANAYEVIK